MLRSRQKQKYCVNRYSSKTEAKFSAGDKIYVQNYKIGISKKWVAVEKL